VAHAQWRSSHALWGRIWISSERLSLSPEVQWLSQAVYLPGVLLVIRRIRAAQLLPLSPPAWTTPISLRVTWESGQPGLPATTPTGTFPTLEVSQGHHVHLIRVAVSCTHLPLNLHIGSEDTLSGK
jgi:hypothetical protein